MIILFGGADPGGTDSVEGLLSLLFSAGIGTGPIPPVSNDTNYVISLNELIREALDVLGVGSEGEPVTADMYRRGKSSLKLMLLGWNAEDNLWRHEQQGIVPIANTASYVLPVKAMRVRSARRKQLVGGYETPMTEWSRQEYLDMPSKTTAPSTPVNFYYDPQRSTGTVYLWPTPSVAVAPTIQIIIDVLRPMFVLDDSNDTLDMPQEWQEAVVYNLAKRLKLKYPVNDPSISAQIDLMADTTFAKLKSFDNEPTSLFLQPDDRWFEWH